MSLIELKPGSEFPENFQRRDNRLEAGLLNPGEKVLPSLASIHESVSSLTLTVNSAMAALSLLIESGDGFAQRVSGPDKKEQFREYFLKMRHEYQAVSVITESLGALSRIVANQSAIVNVDRIDKTDSTQNSNFPSTKIVPAKNSVEG
jgi:hypothetical protein